MEPPIYTKFDYERDKMYQKVIKVFDSIDECVKFLEFIYIEGTSFE